MENNSDVSLDEENIENNSDVSLDEEDEELIGRVFYSGVLGNANDEQLAISEDEDELSSISDLEDIGEPELVAKYKRLRTKTVDKDLSEEERKRLMMMNFSNDQMDRFEAYRRTTINKPGVKKVCHSVLGHSVPQNVAVILAGLSKLFLSEIITRAFDVQEKEFKSRLILDIDEKKQRKKKALQNLELQDSVLVNNTLLTYEGDTPQSLKPEHIREAIRLYKLENNVRPL